MTREEYEFRNLQRIMSDQFSVARTIHGFLFALNMAGAAGLYHVMTREAGDRSAPLSPSMTWARWLGLVMLLVNIALARWRGTERRLRRVVQQRLEELPFRVSPLRDVEAGAVHQLMNFIQTALILVWFIVAMGCA